MRRRLLRADVAKAFIVDGGGSLAFGSSSTVKDRELLHDELSHDVRQHLEHLLDNEDPAIREWAESLLAVALAGPTATKRASGRTSELRAYVERLAANDPNPAVRARADAVLDRLHTEAMT